LRERGRIQQGAKGPCGQQKRGTGQGSNNPHVVR